MGVISKIFVNTIEFFWAIVNNQKNEQANISAVQIEDVDNLYQTKYEDVSEMLKTATALAQEKRHKEECEILRKALAASSDSGISIHIRLVNAIAAYSGLVAAKEEMKKVVQSIPIRVATEFKHRSANVKTSLMYMDLCTCYNKMRILSKRKLQLEAAFIYDLLAAAAKNVALNLQRRKREMLRSSDMQEFIQDCCRKYKITDSAGPLNALLEFSIANTSTSFSNLFAALSLLYPNTVDIIAPFLQNNSRAPTHASRGQ